MKGKEKSNKYVPPVIEEHKLDIGNFPWMIPDQDDIGNCDDVICDAKKESSIGFEALNVDD